MSILQVPLYTQNSSLQKDHAKDILNTYLPLMDWSNNTNILDVGTGDGAVLVNLILPRIPPNYQKIVAVDIDEEMLHSAKSIAKNNPKIQFECLDIATPVIPLKFQGHFDHIFSLYCLHWVMDQKRALYNIYRMLKPSGDILLTIVVNHVIFSIYEKMSKWDRWAPFTSNWEKFVSPYRKFENADVTIKQILESVGFVNCKCEVVERPFFHKNFSEYGKWALSVNPFLSKIPPKEVDYYEHDFLEEVRKVVKFVDNNLEGEIDNSYPFLVVLASKQKKIK